MVDAIRRYHKYALFIRHIEPNAKRPKQGREHFAVERHNPVKGERAERLSPKHPGVG